MCYAFGTELCRRLTGQFFGHASLRHCEDIVRMTAFDEIGSGRRFHRGGQQMLRKAELKELAECGENWALEELHHLLQAERVKSHRAYERFKARRTPEGLRLKWREAKAAQRAAVAAAHAEAEEQKRRSEELAAKAAALAAEAERERKAREPVAESGNEMDESGNEMELEIVLIPPNPRMVICAYRAVSGERRCIVRVGRNTNFRPGMKLLAKQPANGAVAEPWAYYGSLPRRPGRW